MLTLQTRGQCLGIVCGDMIQVYYMILFTASSLSLGVIVVVDCSPPASMVGIVRGNVMVGGRLLSFWLRRALQMTIVSIGVTTKCRHMML